MGRLWVGAWWMEAITVDSAESVVHNSVHKVFPFVSPYKAGVDKFREKPNVENRVHFGMRGRIQLQTASNSIVRQPSIMLQKTLDVLESNR